MVELVATGYTNKEIGVELGVSPQTVKNHMTTVMRKLDANDRTHAVTLALRKGLIVNPV